MMTGYSVTEAASVLGVPTERVWELLARGVLAGAPEGDTGMRVFLQPRPAPAPVTATPDEAAGGPRSSGPEAEASPFRELLTEFRNLTERYGQALLALGESRGEVASLRSRVDLLEARIDLRLPMGAPSAAPWPTQPLPVSEPAPDAGADAAVEHGVEEGRRRRRRGARRATQSFAEALARAEDPSPADLPGGTDAAATAQAAADDVDRSLPRDVLPAEPMPVAEEEPLPETVAAAVAFVEPAPPTDDIDEPAAQLQVTIEPEPAAAEPPPSADDAAAVEPGPAAEPWELAPDVDVPATPSGAWGAEGPAATEHDEGAAVEPSDEPAPESADAAEFDADRYTTVIEQPDWIEAEADEAWATAPRGDETTADIEDSGPDADTSPGDETGAGIEEAAPDPDTFLRDETAADMEEAARDPEPAPGDEPDARETEASGALQEEPAAAEGAPPEDPSTEEAPRAFALDESGDPGQPASSESGADEMEVAGSGQQASVDAEDTAEGLPGSRELDEAMEAFGDIGTRPSATIEPEQEWPPADRAAVIPPSAERLNEFVARARQQTYGSPIPGSPATRAYRRLRRIFPT